MNRRNRKTLQAIFAPPVPVDIEWAAIESLLRACGAELNEGRGSRLRVALNSVRFTFHRPHPKPNTNRASVHDVRRLLTEAGVTP